jgi:hypothetical protein
MTPAEGFRAIWHHKILVAATTLSSLVLSLLWLALVTPEYTASMVIGPVPKDGIKSNSSSLMDMDTLFGIGLNGGLRDKDFIKFLAVLDSVAVAEKIEEHDKVMRVIYEDLWDEETQSWTQPPGIVSTIANGLKGLVGLPDWTPPTPIDLARYIREHVTVEEKEESALRILSFSHKDRDFAIRFLTALHRETDDLLRTEAIRRSSAQIAYLKEKLRTLTVQEQRQTFIDLLSEQEKTMVLLQVGLPFTAAEIDPTSAPIRPTFPKPKLALVLGTIGGFILGCIIALVLFLRRREDDLGA